MGAAGARAIGYAQARGEWITSVDPDDILDRDYFEQVRSFLEMCGDKKPHMLMTRVLPVDEVAGQPRAAHPLDYKFKGGDRLVSLKHSPSTIQLGATAFVSRRFLDLDSDVFDPKIRPTFEDGAFLARYLLKFEEPIVGVVSSARYYYRKRLSGASLVQSGWQSPEKYDDQIVYGYLTVLRHAFYTKGEVPEWLQFTVLYDISWFFTEDIKQGAATDFLYYETEIAAKFLDNLKAVFSYLDPNCVRRFNARNIPWNIRHTWLVYYFPQSFGKATLTQWARGRYSSFSIVTLEDPSQKIKVYSGGKEIQPELEVVSRHYFGHLFTFETYFRVPGDSVSIIYDGNRILPLVKQPLPKLVDNDRNLLVNGQKALNRERKSKLDRAAVLAEVGSAVTRKRRVAFLSSVLQKRASKKLKNYTKPIARFTGNVIKKLAQLPPFEHRYQSAWLIMDRPKAANDNGEHFYRWLKSNHPEINAYFVLSKDSSAWRNLKQEGFRLIDYGSMKNWLAFLNAEVIISSDAVADVMYHAPNSLFGRVRRPFVFLQHGVTRNNLGAWLNPKKIDLTIAATEDEYRYFTSPSSPYLMTSGDVALTGFARFDRLHGLQTDYVDDEITRVLIMPTWRSLMKKDLDRLETSEERSDYVRDSKFSREWRKVLEDDRLLRLIRNGRLKMCFIAHPNFASLLNDFNFPAEVEAVAIQDIDFQKMLVSADLFVSDYSSAAFDAAIAGCRVSYFQFDREEFFSGAHTQRPGYYDEARDGFGPAFRESDELIEWMLSSITDPDSEPELYTMRREALQAMLDGRASERILESIQEMLDRKYR